MTKKTELLPLAFVLAMAAEAGAAPAVDQPVGPLTVGALAALAQQPSTTAIDPDRPTFVHDRLTQFFNFFNCFRGAWRNC
jgi:hypothetical protein